MFDAWRLKFNTNASMKAESGASIGGVLPNATGRVVWCFSERYTTDVCVAEAIAIRRGLEYTHDQDLRDSEVESHAQIVIYTLLHPKHDLNYIDGVVQNILKLMIVFSRVTFVWTR